MDREHIVETLHTPIVGSYDVIVTGGGIAGISAALSAARSGARVLLAERGYMLGGLATAGLVTIYLPLCDGCGRQVSFGLAEELLRLSASMGAEADYPTAWLGNDASDRCKQRFMLRFNPQLFALLAEELLRKSGVEIRYGALLTGADRRDDRVHAAVFEEKGGRFAMTARSFVDATGDADLLSLAGAPTRRFRQGNILAAWYYSLAGGKLKLNPMGACDVPDELKGELKQPELLTNRRFAGLTGSELSEMVCLAHDRVLRDIQARRRENSDIVPVTIATTPQIRMTRCIAGECVLDELPDTHFADNVGRIADWRRRGYVYEIPFGALYNRSIRNVIAAGRCISVTDSMWDITRVIPACAVSGEAAGTAAALTDDMPALGVQKLQQELRRKCARPDI